MTSLMDVYASARQLGDARKVFDEMPGKSVAAWNCMLAAYVQCRELDAALRFFGDEMPYRDTVAWTTVIGGCANSGRAAKAVELFMGMRKARVNDDVVTMVALLTACAELGDLELGRWVHARVDWEGRQRRTVLLDNSLIHMYVKCGGGCAPLVSDDAKAEYHFVDNYDLRSCNAWSCPGGTGFVPQNAGAS
jgi:pentatricopeptide repeat protein